jgi:hypothetical protein
MVNKGQDKIIDGLMLAITYATYLPYICWLFVEYLLVTYRGDQSGLSSIHVYHEEVQQHQDKHNPQGAHARPSSLAIR